MRPDQQKLVARVIAGGLVVLMLFGIVAQALVAF